VHGLRRFKKKGIEETSGPKEMKLYDSGHIFTTIPVICKIEVFAAVTMNNGNIPEDTILHNPVIGCGGYHTV
jgi:hypothetical protein